MLRSQDIQVFVFLIIHELPNLWRDDDTRCIFEYIFWTTTH